mgnify:CR=1 FL=1
MPLVNKVLDATRIRHVLSFDVEDWYQGFLSRRIGGWQDTPSREADIVDHILELLQEARVSATFFVLGQFAEREPAVVSKIARAGHEVASHGYAHKPLRSFSQESFRSDLKRSIDVLENIIGDKVIGHRATSWSLMKSSLWALETMAELGLRYDSSIFPTSFHKFGLPSSPPYPHRIVLDSGNWLTEFPAQVLSVGLLRIPAAGGFYLRALPLVFSKAALKQSERRRSHGMVYLHPYDLDADVPRIKVPLAFRVIRYYNLGKTETYLRSLLSSFRFSPIKDLLSSITASLPVTQIR